MIYLGNKIPVCSLPGMNAHRARKTGFLQRLV
jgi:hypothetical protein